MLLALDVGNTNTVIGVFAGDEVFQLAGAGPLDRLAVKLDDDVARLSE